MQRDQMKTTTNGPTMLQPRLSFLMGLLLYTVSVRLLPYILSLFGMSIDPSTTWYPWNFSPLPAICLFGAAHFADRRWSYLVPLGALLLGDLGIWALTGRADWAFYPNQPIVYGCFAFTITLGFFLRRHRSVLAIGGTGLLASTVFFIVTNFGVWALGNGIRYPHNLAGLIDCYVMAIPFFRNSLISMAVFSTVLFSRVALAVSEQPEYQTVPVTAAK